MSLYEHKSCPSCGEKFECKEANMVNCSCAELDISTSVAEFLNEEYEECICTHCLKKYQSEFDN